MPHSCPTRPSRGLEVVVGIAIGGRVSLALPRGVELRSARDGAQAAGFPISLDPGEVVSIHHDGSGWRVERGGVRALEGGNAQIFQESDDRSEEHTSELQ